MISNEYGDVRKVQVRRTAEFENLHNYGWIQSGWGWGRLRGSYFDCDAISPLLSSPYFLTTDLPCCPAALLLNTTLRSLRSISVCGVSHLVLSHWPRFPGKVIKINHWGKHHIIRLMFSKSSLTTSVMKLNFIIAPPTFPRLL